MDHNSPRPPLRSLEVTVAVSLHGSLTGAAEALGLTHGAASRHVKATEDWLGLRLFERHGRGMRPTDDGARFLRQVERGLGAIEAAADRWHRRRGRHVVRIGVTPTFAELWLLERIPALEAGEPPLRIEIAAQAGFADLDRGEVDLVIRYTRELDPRAGPTLFLSETLYPVAAPELAARLGPAPDPEAILACPLLHDSDAAKWRAWCEAAAGRPFRPAARDRRFENYLLTLTAARAGLGVALGQRPIADAAGRRARPGAARRGGGAGPARLSLHRGARRAEGRRRPAAAAAAGGGGGHGGYHA